MMPPPTHQIVGAMALAATLLAPACGDDAGDGTSGPPPADMCPEGEELALAAYDLESGEFRWATCSTTTARHSVADASDEVVYLEVDGGTEFRGYSAADGTELPAGGTAPAPSRPTDTTTSPVVDGVRIEGGQGDPTTAFDDDTGAVLWTQPGSPAYDDLWAVGDGAVYVVNQQVESGFPQLVAYELTSGETRWSMQQDMADELWPWHVDDGVLFAVWNNLALIATDDGSTIWRTDYPAVEFPRMTDVDTNSDTVFVAFSSIASGGD